MAQTKEKKPDAYAQQLNQAMAEGQRILGEYKRLTAGGKALSSKDKERIRKMIEAYMLKYSGVMESAEHYKDLLLWGRPRPGEKKARIPGEEHAREYFALLGLGTELAAIGKTLGYVPVRVQPEREENVQARALENEIAVVSLMGYRIQHEYVALMAQRHGNLTTEDKKKLLKMVWEYEDQVGRITAKLNAFYKNEHLSPQQRGLLRSQHWELINECAQLVQFAAGLYAPGESVLRSSPGILLPEMTSADMDTLAWLPEREQMQFIRFKELFTQANLKAARFDSPLSEDEKRVVQVIMAFFIDKYGDLAEDWVKKGKISKSDPAYQAFLQASGMREIKQYTTSAGKAFMEWMNEKVGGMGDPWWLPMQAYREAIAAQGGKYGDQANWTTTAGLRYWGEAIIDSYLLYTGVAAVGGLVKTGSAVLGGELTARKAVGRLLEPFYKGGGEAAIQWGRVGEVGPFVRLGRAGQAAMGVWRAEGALSKTWQGARIVGNVVMMPVDTVRKVWRIYTLPAKALDAMISKSSYLKYGVPLALHPGVAEAYDKLPTIAQISLWSTNYLFMLSWISDIANMWVYHPEKFNDSERKLNLEMFGMTLLLHVPSAGKGLVMRYLGVPGEKADAISKAIFEEMAGGTFTLESLKKILSANGVSAEKAGGLMQKFEELKLWLAIGKPVVQSDVALRLQQMGITKNADLISKAIAEDLEAGKLSAQGIQSICSRYGVKIDAAQAGQIFESANSVFKLAQEAANELRGGKPGSAFIKVAYKYRKFFEAGYYGGVVVSTQTPMARQMAFDIFEKPMAARDMAKALVELPPVVDDDLKTLWAYANKRDWASLEKQLAIIEERMANPPFYLPAYGEFVKSSQAYFAAKILLDIHKSLVPGKQMTAVDARRICKEIAAYQAIFGENLKLEALVWGGAETIGEQGYVVPGFWDYGHQLEGEEPRVFNQAQIDGMIRRAYNAFKPEG